MRAVFFCILLFLAECTTAHAQTNQAYKITGKIKDSASKLPVEYASVSVTDQKTLTVVNGAVTDTSGYFQVNGLSAGTFMITIDFIGYQKKQVNDIILSTSSKAASLNTLALTPSVNVLSEMTVTGSKAIVENQIDKIVYNAVNDITSQAGVALDVLKKVPQVSVDIDGNVELQGNPNVRFLINGKPSSVFGNSLTDALASIPASQIKSIEAVTSPGAKYDAQGTGGIINIILKDNRLQGVNGTVNLSAGTRLENGSGNLNLRHNNFGFNAFYSGNKQLSSRTPSTQDRLSNNALDSTTTRLLQNGYQDFQRSGYRSGIGFDWALSKKDNLTGSAGYNNFSSKSNGITGIVQSIFNADGQLLSTTNLSRVSGSSAYNSTLDWSLNYIKKLKKDGQELNLLYSSSFGKPRSKYSQIQNDPNERVANSGTVGNTPGKDKLTNISIDYSHPVTKNSSWKPV